MSFLITGGTGSYGNAFVNQLLKGGYGPGRIIIYSRDEQKQEDMARRLGALGVEHPKLRFFLGDVRDADRLSFAMRDVQYVIHAAALKIVTAAEYNPTECIATNIGGAENVVKAAIRAKVHKVLALSTDKAVNPVNLYGASKLAAEKVFVAANALSAGLCVFSVMRYGNVVGSRGSVVPLFKALAAENKPLTITDERMTRFWITLEQAVQFTFDCLDQMKGREIFVPKLPSMLVTDLAKVIGIKPDGSRSPLRFTGIRPGEKLHEVLLTEDEARTTEDRTGLYVIQPHNRRFDESAVRVPEGFRYESNTNKMVLTPELLKDYIADWEKAQHGH